MALHNIEKFNYLYAFLKPFMKFTFNCIWFRNVEITNKNLIPDNEALIILPCHQNALMDDLAIVYNVKGQTVFLARSDIFKGRFVKALLYFFKLMPVFRIRDGKDQLKNNDYTFQRCVEILRKRKKICLMAEGNHAADRTLRTIKKGFARIAFLAEEAENFQLNLKLQPVGIEFGDYYNFRTTLLVNFAEPICVAEYVAEYKINPQKAMIRLMDKLRESLGKVMIDIKSKEFYSSIYRALSVYKFEIAKIYNKRKTSLYEKFKADKLIIEKLEALIQSNPKKMEGFHQRMIEYFEFLKAKKIRDWVVNKGKIKMITLTTRAILLFLSLPVFLYGFLNNLFVLIFAKYSTRNLKDLQFVSTYRYTVSLITIPVSYLLQSLVVFMIFDNVWICLVYLTSLLPSGLFAYHYHIWYRKLMGLIRFRNLFIKKKKEYDEILMLRSSIIQILDELCRNELKNLVKI